MKGGWQYTAASAWSIRSSSQSFAATPVPAAGGPASAARPSASAAATSRGVEALASPCRNCICRVGTQAREAAA